MSKHKIRLTTLTPVHVGSGKVMRRGVDFVVTPNGDIHVIDMNRFARTLGDDPALFQAWAQYLEKGNAAEFVASRTRQFANTEAFSLRRIANPNRLLTRDSGYERDIQLKELIHDGRGLPYIPGSSIKGAIRTAIINTLLTDDILNAFSSQVRNRETLNDFRKKKVEALLGANPNSDALRFLRIPDVYFPGGVEVALREVNLNERKSTNVLFDDSKTQVVEMINVGCVTEFQLMFNVLAAYNPKVCENIKGAIRSKPYDEYLTSIERLFKMLNDYMLDSIKRELDAIEKIAKDVNAEDNDNDYLNYEDQLTEIKDAINDCDSSRCCIMRLGQGIGWRFTTGGKLQNKTVREIARPDKARPDKKKYEGYVFPKSRRIADDINPLLGFVKLELVED